MNWKEFLEPNKKKIILSFILFLCIFDLLGYPALWDLKLAISNFRYIEYGTPQSVILPLLYFFISLIIFLFISYFFGCLLLKLYKRKILNLKKMNIILFIIISFLFILYICYADYRGNEDIYGILILPFIFPVLILEIIGSGYSIIGLGTLTLFIIYNYSLLSIIIWIYNKRVKRKK